MGVDVGSHHLTTFIQLKVTEDHVLKDEWQTIKQMYPIFVVEMRRRTRVDPVLEHNFQIHLKKLCSENRAEFTESLMTNVNGTKRYVKLYRRKNNGGM